MQRASRSAARLDPALARSLGLDGARVLGFIGSFYGYEGLALLLQALPGMLERMPSIRVLLVGGGYEEEALKRQAAAGRRRRQGHIRRASAARARSGLLQPGRHLRLPPQAHAGHRAGYAAQAARSDGAGTGRGGFGRRRSPGAHTAGRDGAAVQGGRSRLAGARRCSSCCSALELRRRHARERRADSSRPNAPGPRASAVTPRSTSKLLKPPWYGVTH